MKRFGTISCICSALLLSSCAVTTISEATLNEARAQAQAAQEWSDTLLKEYKTAVEEAQKEGAGIAQELRVREARGKAEHAARIAAEAAQYVARMTAEKEAEENRAKIEEEERAQREAAEKEAEAREKAEAEARKKAEEEEEARRKAEKEAEERAAREAAEKEAEENRARLAEEKSDKGQSPRKDDSPRREPRLLSSRARHAKAEDTPSPTAEQQAAAQKMLKKQTNALKKEPKRASKPTVSHEKTEIYESEQPQDIRNALRVRRFAPPEEAISRENDDEPMPNSVELRGLRSPIMKGQLPMNIDGKINKDN